MPAFGLPQLFGFFGQLGVKEGVQKLRFVEQGFVLEQVGGHRAARLDKGAFTDEFGLAVGAIEAGRPGRGVLGGRRRSRRPTSTRFRAGARDLPERTFS